jgi:hypothetical protein
MPLHTFKKTLCNPNVILRIGPLSQNPTVTTLPFLPTADRFRARQPDDYIISVVLLRKDTPICQVVQTLEMDELITTTDFFFVVRFED